MVEKIGSVIHFKHNCTCLKRAMVSILLDVVCCSYIAAGLKVPAVTEGDSQCSFMFCTTGLLTRWLFHLFPLLLLAFSSCLLLLTTGRQFYCMLFWFLSIQYVTETHTLSVLNHFVNPFRPYVHYSVFFRFFCIEFYIIKVQLVIYHANNNNKILFWNEAWWPMTQIWHESSYCMFISLNV